MAEDLHAKMRAKREAEEREQAESAQRAREHRYSILKVSDRRWRVIEHSGSAMLMHGIRDVEHFVFASDPLDWSGVVEALRKLRGPA